MTIDIKLNLRRQQFSLNVEAALPSDAVTAIYGASGSGKTTLLRAIAGLDRHEGQLSMQSQVWQDTTTFVPTHKRKLAYVFQEASLFEHLTVQGNLAYASKRVQARQINKAKHNVLNSEAQRERVKKKTHQFLLDEVIHLLNIGQLLTRMPHELSGGERQRVAIARALASSPDLLLMDEPLASLDRQHKQEILPYLTQLHQQFAVPILYVSHAIEEVAQLADHMLLIERDGNVVMGETQQIVTRLDLVVATESNAGAVIDAIISSHDHDYGLSYLTFAGGKLSIVTHAAIADLLPGSEVRLHLAARDISITLKRPTDSSILNVFEAVVDELSPQSKALMTVRLMVGGVPILAKVTCKSSQQLALKKGKLVFVQAKSVALLR